MRLNRQNLVGWADLTDGLPEANWRRDWPTLGGATRQSMPIRSGPTALPDYRRRIRGCLGSVRIAQRGALSGIGLALQLRIAFVVVRRVRTQAASQCQLLYALMGTRRLVRARGSTEGRLRSCPALLGASPPRRAAVPASCCELLETRGGRERPPRRRRVQPAPPEVTMTHSRAHYRPGRCVHR